MTVKGVAEHLDHLNELATAPGPMTSRRAINFAECAARLGVHAVQVHAFNLVLAHVEAELRYEDGEPTKLAALSELRTWLLALRDGELDGGSDSGGGA